MSDADTPGSPDFERIRQALHGRYEVERAVGAGGMASVYLAVQKSLQRRVVLKILYPHLAEDEKLVQRFEREARAAAMMRHENIIQVIDCGRHDDVAYIAMEFVEGMDLKKWIEANKTPPLEMALLMLQRMFLVVPGSLAVGQSGLAISLALSAWLAMVAPNSFDLHRVEWRLTVTERYALAAAFGASLALMAGTGSSPFLYFQF